MPAPPSRAGELRPDVLAQADSDRLDGDPDGVLDRVRRRGAVADDRYAFHAEQRRAAVLGVVEDAG